MAKINYKCCICNCKVPRARAEFLLENHTHYTELTCITHSTTTRIQALYSGENGTSDLIFCRKVYNDSVRSKLYSAEEAHSQEDDYEDD